MSCVVSEQDCLFSKAMQKEKRQQRAWEQVYRYTISFTQEKEAMEERERCKVIAESSPK